MKKRILSIALAALLLCGFAQLAFAEEAPPPEEEITVILVAPEEEAAAEEGNLQAGISPTSGNLAVNPTIFGAGAWHYLYEFEGTPQERLVFDPGKMMGGDSSTITGVLDSILSLDFDAFGDGLIQMWENAYGEVAMDRHGESVNKNITSDLEIVSRLGPLWALNDAGQPYDYKLVVLGLQNSQAWWNFDWRLDPWDNAKKLHDYFEHLIDTYGKGNTNTGGSHNGYTGPAFDKFNFNAISGSGPIALAYLARYGTKYLSSLVFNISMHAGSTLFGSIARGNFGFDAASLAQGGLSMFGLQDGKTEDNPLSELGPVINALYQVGLLDGLLKTFNFAARGAYDKFYEKALLPLWFHVPTYWGMVPLDQYDEAKAYMLKGNSKYNQLLFKTDRYHYDCLENQERLIRDAASKIKLSVRVGYGPPLSPYAIGTNVSSDKLVDTYYASLGATCAEPGRPFPRSYKQVNPGPAGKENCYVSPDRLVDASTCMLPDVTWFAKDLPHTAQWSYSGWYAWWLGADSYTIWDNPLYPQYSQWAPKAPGEIFDYFTPLEVEEPTWLDGLKEFGLLLLSFWRKLVLLPLFWM